jgi:hypothetical protein
MIVKGILLGENEDKVLLETLEQKKTVYGSG